jgi:hypothetical protein
MEWTMKYKVDEVFARRGSVVPLDIPNLPVVFDSLEDLLNSFDKPEELYVVTYSHGGRAVAHIRDKRWIEHKQQLTDKFIALTGKEIGHLTAEDATWVTAQVERALLESN